MKTFTLDLQVTFTFRGIEAEDENAAITRAERILDAKVRELDVCGVECTECEEDEAE